MSTALIVSSSIAAYVVIGAVVSGLLARSWYDEPLDSDEQFATVISGIFWPIALLCCGVFLLHYFAYSFKRQQESEEIELPVAKVVSK